MIGHIGSAVVAELDALLQRGLVADIFRMERAYSLLDEIGSNAVRINDKVHFNRRLSQIAFSQQRASSINPTRDTRRGAFAMYWLSFPKKHRSCQRFANRSNLG
jgi:hypothetical protein